MQSSFEMDNKPFVDSSNTIDQAAGPPKSMLQKFTHALGSTVFLFGTRERIWDLTLLLPLILIAPLFATTIVRQNECPSLTKDDCYYKVVRLTAATSSIALFIVVSRFGDLLIALRGGLKAAFRALFRRRTSAGVVIRPQMWWWQPASSAFWSLGVSLLIWGSLLPEKTFWATFVIQIVLGIINDPGLAAGICKSSIVPEKMPGIRTVLKVQDGSLLKVRSLGLRVLSKRLGIVWLPKTWAYPHKDCDTMFSIDGTMEADLLWATIHQAGSSSSDFVGDRFLCQCRVRALLKAATEAKCDYLAFVAAASAPTAKHSNLIKDWITMERPLSFQPIIAIVAHDSIFPSWHNDLKSEFSPSTLQSSPRTSQILEFGLLGLLDSFKGTLWLDANTSETCAFGAAAESTTAYVSRPNSPDSVWAVRDFALSDRLLYYRDLLCLPPEDADKNIFQTITPDITNLKSVEDASPVNRVVVRLRPEVQNLVREACQYAWWQLDYSYLLLLPPKNAKCEIPSSPADKLVLYEGAVGLRVKRRMWILSNNLNDWPIATSSFLVQNARITGIESVQVASSLNYHPSRPLQQDLSASKTDTTTYLNMNGEEICIAMWLETDTSNSSNRNVLTAVGLASLSAPKISWTRLQINPTMVPVTGEE
ncbi:uncharacterized protein VTP21DRAFT_11320 [Calcarisporiella thermophila]|uniref:uncharacterized protein n=1 Tax=Calcarisporiella thermophila TaxID=911321 RepID=UPI00374299C3